MICGYIVWTILSTGRLFKMHILVTSHSFENNTFQQVEQTHTESFFHVVWINKNTKYSSGISNVGLDLVIVQCYIHKMKLLTWESKITRGKSGEKNAFVTLVRLCDLIIKKIYELIIVLEKLRSGNVTCKMHNLKCLSHDKWNEFWL